MKTGLDQFILVAGGAGFIGSHLVDRLILLGNKVIVVDDLSTGVRNQVNKEALFYCGKIENQLLLEKIFSQHKISTVYHLAAVINEGIDSECSLIDANVSAVGTINLLDFSIRFQVVKFIFVSSVSVYGVPKEIPVTESAKLSPINSYGISKLFAEKYVQYYGDKYGLPYHILRYGNIYGPRQPKIGEVGVISIFTQRAINGQKFKIYGDGRQRRDFLYVEDCVNMTIEMSRVSGNNIVNIASGKSTSIIELVNIFIEFFEGNVSVNFLPKTKDEIGEFVCSCNVFYEIFPDYQSVELRDGIRKTINYFLAMNNKNED